MATLIGALEKGFDRTGPCPSSYASNGGRELDEQTPWGDPTVGEVIITWVGD